MQLWQYCLLVTARSLTCFGRFLCPSSGLLKTVVTATGACRGLGWCISSKDVQGWLSTALCHSLFRTGWPVLNRMFPHGLTHAAGSEQTQTHCIDCLRCILRVFHVHCWIYNMCFQLATQGPCAHLSEGEKLTHELQLVEQGIREKEKELRLVCNISSEDKE